MSDTARDTVTNNGHNILIITCDQYQYPRFSYGRQGFDDALKRVLGFVKDLGKDNPYAKFFPGLMRLRENAVVLKNHTIAASACTPSRATIYTGQYGTRTGVTQTDGLFKSENSAQFPWLKVDSIPTLGHWMREAGYETHYFGKWHISNPPGHSLEQYGFDSWEESYPEPHGALANNLGLYRDVGFADAASRFIRRRGLALNYNRVVAEADRLAPLAPPPDGSRQRPWLAVVSFTNPHDIATYPGVISQALPPVTDAPGPGGQPPKSQSPLGPLSVPVPGARSLPPFPGTMQLHLNPLGFPQGCATNAPTLHEDLSQKPGCQAEYAYKMGLALASKLGFNVASGAQAQKGGDHTQALEALAVATSLQSSIPFQRAADPDSAALAFMQVYAWLHSVVDPHIQQVLQALEDSGQKQNTVVVFLADHGEYAGAHGMMMEKWHTAYQEALHVPVVIQLNPYAAPVDGTEKEGAQPGAPRLPPSPEPRELDALTSHIDLLPTVLGLAGVDAHARARIYEALKGRFKDIAPLPGLDLSPLILGQSDALLEADGQPRRGVLFITSDEITAPFPPSDDPHDARSQQEFAIFDKVVQVVARGTPGHAPVPLKPGPVCQPNNVHAVRTDRYKLARTFDPSGAVSQQWELYDLQRDPNEQHNLADLNTTPPVPSTNLPAWASAGEIAAVLADLDALLQSLEQRML